MNSIADPEIATALQTLLTWANGNIDAINLSATLAQSVGLNQSGQTVKGAANIGTSQSTASTTYTTLATPDQVSNLVLPTNGLIAVNYQATWQESVAGAARAAIFVGSNQLQVAALTSLTTHAAPAAQAARTNGPGGNPAAVNMPLFSFWGGLASPQQTDAGGSPYSGDITTGQAIGLLTTGAETINMDVGGNLLTLTGPTGCGGPCYIFAAAGTYTISVMFKASSGTVTASNRKLWAQSISFS